MASSQKTCNWLNLTCRQVLNIMVILGFMLNYMLRVNLTIAIVTMVIPHNNSQPTDTWVNECGNDAPQMSNSSIDLGIPSNRNGTNMKTLLPFHEDEEDKEDKRQVEDSQQIVQTRYPWNEYQINLILGSFYWGYVFTELPGGRLAEIIGAKRVFGYSMLISSAITFLTPIVSSFGYIAVAILRSILGFMLGVTWPSIQPMTAHWIPPDERSKFVSNMMASSLGAAITMPLSGYLIASFGWESVFYVTGTIGILWSISWFLFVFDSPAQHPRISEEEKNYIEDSIGTTITKTRLPVPWKNIFTSFPVWAIIITHTCSVFGYFTVVNQLPTYMKYILHFNIKENGLLSSLPYLGKYLFALVTSAVADYFRRTNKLTVTQIRKYFTLFAVMIPGLLMIVQAYAGCDRTTSVFIFTFALTINGAVCAGYLGNGLDIAPNFSGTIFGIANTLSSIGGFVSSFMVGVITNNNQRYSRWSIIFWILAIIYCCGALIFTIFGTGELQNWNDPRKIKKKADCNKEESAMLPLKEKVVT